MIDYIEKGDDPINVAITKYSYSQLDALGRDQLIKFDRVDALYMGGNVHVVIKNDITAKEAEQYQTPHDSHTCLLVVARAVVE